MVISLDWFDTLQKKQRKGMRKLSQYLEENGYSIVEQKDGGKHLTIKVKRLEDKDKVDAETIVTTVSHRVSEKGDNKSRLKMVLREVQNMFKGRKRRGQGNFKLSENYNQESWADILKINASAIYSFIQLLIDADLPLQMGRRLNEKMKQMYPATTAGTRTRRRVSDDKTVTFFNNKVYDMSVIQRARIASKLAGLYETTDDTSLKPGKREGPPLTRTHQEQFENITDEELESLVKYMLHLIETM